MRTDILVFLAVGAVVAIFLVAHSNAGSSIARAVDQPLRAVGLKSDPDKLGWMDDEEYTAADRARVASLTSNGASSNLGVIRSIQSGLRGEVTRRDFELIRQDRRRAQAAYPDASKDQLYDGVWLSVDLSARVPGSFCASGNSNGTEVDGKMYLDGGCYVGIVKPEYPNRADAQTTKRVLAELKDEGRQKSLKQVSKWGYSTAWGGTGGSGRIECYPDPLPSDQEADDLRVAGKCVVVLDDTKYVFPFVASEWIDPPRGEDGIKKLASFQQMTSEAYKPVDRPWTIKDGLLAHGETCAPGRLCSSKWNGDGYDNNDIGPDTPASWVLGWWGTHFTPAPDNGERRSSPDKPWFVVISWYGSTPQASGGWTEAEAKALLPKFLTEMSLGMQGQDNEELNRGNLREARATQIPPGDGVMLLAERSMPVRPMKQARSAPCVQGGTLMPGQSCTFGSP